MTKKQIITAQETIQEFAKAFSENIAAFRENELALEAEICVNNGDVEVTITSFPLTVEADEKTYYSWTTCNTPEEIRSAIKEHQEKLKKLQQINEEETNAERFENSNSDADDPHYGGTINDLGDFIDILCAERESK